MNTHPSTTVAMLLSCDSFESFYGSVLDLDKDKYLQHYRNDWSWYYAAGVVENAIRPIIYIPSLEYSGIHETDAGISVRFLPLAWWYRPLAPFRRAMRATRWSLYFQERINTVAFGRSLREALAADKADALYVQEYWGGRFDHLAQRVSIPIFAADHGGLAQGVVKWFKRSSFRRAAMLYSQTVDECTQVERFGGRVSLQPNGSDTAFFVPPPSGTARTKNILTVARLTDKQKRTSDLIRAMVRLPADWTLDIVGTGPDREMLESLAAELDVSSRVNFHGFRNRDEIRSYLQGCGVYAMPSDNEAMCIAVLEAMSCGAAVVASRIRTFESLITDDSNGKLFAVGDVGGLVEAIQSAWAGRMILGPAATLSVATAFNSRRLYRQLAQSITTNAGLCRAAQ